MEARDSCETDSGYRLIQLCFDCTDQRGRAVFFVDDTADSPYCKLAARSSVLYSVNITKCYPAPVNRRIRSIGGPTLFEMDKLDQTANLMSNVNVEREYSQPSLYLGTSAFTSACWQGSFYPPGMQPRK